MPSHTLLPTPTAMPPAVSASYSAATGASDLHQAFTTAQMTVQAAAYVVAAPLAAAASALADLWSRLKHAVRRLFGARPHMEATATATTNVATSAATDTPTAMGVVADASGTPLAIEATVAHQVEPVAALVAPCAVAVVVAGHALARDGPLLVAVEAALIRRHAALGFVPRDTVLEMVSCLLATRGDRAVVHEDALLLFDGVLRVLARHDFDVEATYADLAPRWMRCLRFAKRQRKYRALVDELEDFERQLEEVRRTHAALTAPGSIYA